MRTWLQRYLLLSAILAVVSVGASAGVETEVIDKTQVVKAVSGVVRDPRGDPISGATVAEVTPDLKTVIQSTTTDERGHFVLHRIPGTKIHNLVISRRPFNPLVVHVRVSKWTKKPLELKLELST